VSADDRLAKRRVTWSSATIEELRALQDPDEPDLVAALVEMFRNDARALLGELSDHAARGDFHRVHEIAHRVKGGASNLGAEKVAAAAAALDAAATRGDAAAVALFVRQIVDECGRFLARTAGR